MPPFDPTPALEVATAKKVAAERPLEYQGRSKAPDQSLTDWLTNVTYWTVHGDKCPPKLPAQGFDECRAAWIRIRAAVDLELHAQAPKAAGAWVWPLATLPRRWNVGGSLGARRPWKKTKPQTRYHCGVDLGAPAGTPILAPEGGVVLSGQHGWESQIDKKTGQLIGVKAVVMQADSGRTILLGGVRPGTGASKGTRVVPGQQVGVVGNYPLGDSMCHVQLWNRPLTISEVIKRQEWKVGQPRPDALIDPAEFLQPILAAAPQALVIGEPTDENAEQDEGTPEGAPVTIGLGDFIARVLGVDITSAGLSVRAPMPGRLGRS